MDFFFSLVLVFNVKKFTEKGFCEYALSFFVGQYLPLPGRKVRHCQVNDSGDKYLYPFIIVYIRLYTVLETEVELLPAAQGRGAHRPFNPMLLFFV